MLFAGSGAHHQTHERLSGALSNDANAGCRRLVASKETGLRVLQRVGELGVDRVSSVIPGANPGQSHQNFPAEIPANLI
jgi:hypothetical protein